MSRKFSRARSFLDFPEEGLLSGVGRNGECTSTMG